MATHVADDPVARVDRLLGELDAIAEPSARGTATELVQALVDLYGEGLARAMGRLDDAGRAALAEDELVAHLLLVHDLHPVPLRLRVEQALEEVRPYLESHGGGVELAGLEDGVVALRMHGSCDGCPSSAMTLQLAIEEAIQKAAPEVDDIRAEGVAEPAAPSALLQIRMPSPSWETIGPLEELTSGRALLRDVAGTAVLFVRLAAASYAYRPTCPGCDGELGPAALAGAELACAACGRHYDVRRAGRCLDEPALHLEPIPLLRGEAGEVRVAL